MKQVQFQNTEKSVDYQSIVNNSHVGVLWGAGDKAMILKDYDGKFRGLGNTSSNLTSAWGTESKQAYAIKANDQAGVQVFTFESHKELLTWFANK